MIMTDRVLVLPEMGMDDRVDAAVTQIKEQDIAGVLDIRELTNGQIRTLRGELGSIERYKGASKIEIDELMANPLVLGGLSVRSGLAGGMIAGSTHETADVLRTGLRIVGLVEGVKVASSCFLMRGNAGGNMIFADCAVNPDPDANALAQIAMDSARTARLLGVEEPRVAMLSFYTGESATSVSPLVDKMTEATRIIKERDSGLIVFGPVQFDAAFVPGIAEKKGVVEFSEAPANVFIFPNLDSGNIGYKLAERLGELEAIGPILQGFKNPINDLSRGCSIADIVELARITVQQQS